MSNISHGNEGIKDINKYYNYFDRAKPYVLFITGLQFSLYHNYNENFLWLKILWYENIACTSTHRNIA